MKLTWRQIDLRLRRTFKIAHGATDVRHNIVVEIEAGDTNGLGEAEPTNYYNETAETAAAALAAFDPAPLAMIEQDVPVDLIVAECAQRLGKNISVVAALDAALWDIRGKQLGKPVWTLLGAPGTCKAPTSYTIGMADPDTMARAAEEVKDRFRVLKIKVGGEHDIACLRAIRSVTPMPVRVDANAAWTADEALDNLGRLREFGIELIEQPCARWDIDGLRRVRASSMIPVIADESCHTVDDVEALAGVVDGINIKLVKSGGLCEARRMAVRAGELGLKRMVGCMTSSSLAITAAAQVAGWCDYVDLDGNLLLLDDPFRGAGIDQGCVTIPDKPGLGVTGVA